MQYVLKIVQERGVRSLGRKASGPESEHLCSSQELVYIATKFKIAFGFSRGG